ncbi:hypothetical protein GT391_01945 [Pectobacterium brasiliense]|uniref:hypothetical protein n=1 Tax=Pectobacterium brasiliense TaxID=180957 RepID=UPI0009077DAB|nr:hypothetical protein [Pectobacterium brasiliense]MBN3186082.1 hypothetical protein [Pectobacterium brasiliense]QHG26913.1 hypothetical protein GT391_01945 [Pectobacterium brasiliense]
MNFKIGDEVLWTSSSNGSTKTKIGVVVELIPAEVSVRKSKFSNYLDASRIPRKEESYIVCVGPKPGSRARPKYYWPRVSALNHHKDN